MSITKQDLSQAQADRQWLDAWAEIAEACESALHHMHPSHPRRQELASLHRDARRAAGYDAEAVKA